MRRRRRTPLHNTASGPLVPFLAAVLIAVVLTVVGSGLIRMALVDYTTYTERVTAVVSELVVVRDKDGGYRRTDVYVDYQVGQEYFERQPLSGSWSGEPEVGDTFELAYPPGAPEDAVTVSMLDAGTQRGLLWLGVGLIAFGVLLVVVLGVRHLYMSGRIARKYEPPAQHPGRPTVAPVDPATLPQPWPWEQVVAHAAKELGNRGYRVANLGEKFEVTDESGAFAARWGATGARRYGHSEVYFDERARGMNRAAWSRSADVDVAEKVAMEVGAADLVVSGVLRGAGWKPRMGGEAIGAIVVAGIGLLGGLAAVVVLLLFR